jgi:hypothetical protein
VDEGEWRRRRGKRGKEHITWEWWGAEWTDRICFRGKEKL